MLIPCRGRFLEYTLNHPDVVPVWKRFTEHEFVLNLGGGTLPVESFKDYLVQDYLYLVCLSFTCCLLLTGQTHFARSNALASYKGKTMESIAAVSPVLLQMRMLD